MTMDLAQPGNPEPAPKVHYFYAPAAGALICFDTTDGKRVQVKFKDHHFQTTDAIMIASLRRHVSYRKRFWEVTGRVPVPAISVTSDMSTGRFIDQDIYLNAKARADAMAAAMMPADEARATDLELTQIQANRNAIRMDVDRDARLAEEKQKSDILQKAEEARKAYKLEGVPAPDPSTVPLPYGIDEHTGEKIVVPDTQDA